MIQSKVCRCCFQEKSVTDFYRNRTQQGGYHATCKACSELRKRKYKLLDPESVRETRRRCYLKNETTLKAKLRQSNYIKEWRLKTFYGMTHDEFLTALEMQGYTCSLCGLEFIDGTNAKPQIDHDHETGEVRGIICKRCNQGLGCLGDTIEALNRAIAYLKEAPLKKALQRIRHDPSES